MQKTIALTTALALWTTAVQADGFTDAVIAKFQERDFDFIEVKEGPTQVKVEAIRGSQKLEVIYDRATGSILKQEQERADRDEIGRSGIEIDRRNRDFLDGGDLAGRSDEDDNDDDDYDDDRRSGRDDDDDDRSDHDNDDHDDDDDDDESDDDDDDDDSDDEDDDDDDDDS